MQFFKQIKGKVLSFPAFEKQGESEEGKEQNRRAEKKQKDIKSFAKSILNKFIDQGIGPRETRLISEISATVSQQIQQCEPSIAESEQFILNVVNQAALYQKNKKQKISKAKNLIYSKLQLEPLYTLENNTLKILKMELDQLSHSSQQQFTERIYELSVEKDNVLSTIKDLLIQKQLTRAFEIDSFDFANQCFSLIQATLEKCEASLQKINVNREKLSFVLKYVNKICKLNKKRIILVKKIDLLKRMKGFKSSIPIFENIDQAFYVERNRQKLYNQLSTHKLKQKVIPLQILLKTIRNQNQKVLHLIHKQLSSWGNANNEKKHIQKCLILIYFIQTEKMYKDEGFNLNLSLCKNKKEIREQLREVICWQDYKYINDKAMKAQVKTFLDGLILQLESEEKEGSENVRKKKKMEISLGKSFR